MENENVPDHMKLAQDKAMWDSEQLLKSQEFASKTEVVITGINIPFLNLVSLIIKITFAAIPAVIFVTVIWVCLMSIFVCLHRNFG